MVPLGLQFPRHPEVLERLKRPIVLSHASPNEAFMPQFLRDLLKEGADVGRAPEAGGPIVPQAIA